MLWGEEAQEKHSLRLVLIQVSALGSCCPGVGLLLFLFTQGREMKTKNQILTALVFLSKLCNQPVISAFLSLLPF